MGTRAKPATPPRARRAPSGAILALLWLGQAGCPNAAAGEGPAGPDARSEPSPDAGDPPNDWPADARPANEDPDDAVEIPFGCPGGQILPGLNTLPIAGATRTFYADFPANVDQPLGVMFSWHGFVEDTEAFRAARNFDPDQDLSAPVIVVTPDDAGLLPPAGLDWDFRDDPGNPDVALFEGILGCLAEQYPIDATRIYSFGFSAGAVMTNLLHTRHPALLSAIVTVSGAWFNDPQQVAMVNLVNFFVANVWNWRGLDPDDGGVVLLTHGGPNDVTVLDVMNLEAAAQAAVPFLNGAGRIVVDCAHDSGHTVHPEVTGEVISRFFAAHRAGHPSPYASGGFGGFPASCILRLP